MAQTMITDEQQADTFTALLDRLNRQSVERHFDAYADVAWDDEAYRIDPDDPRWASGPDDPLTETAWYKALPPEVQARIGLHTTATKMKIGLQFESILKRGLLEFAAKLPNGTPEFRYAYHEVIEEAQHSLRFQEFVNRSGTDVRCIPPFIRFWSRQGLTLSFFVPCRFITFSPRGVDPIPLV